MKLVPLPEPESGYIKVAPNLKKEGRNYPTHTQVWTGIRYIGLKII